jgi:hypothetical protein
MKKQPITIRIFISSVCALLLITAFAKIISANGTARILQNQDPILNVSFQNIFWVVGIIEIVIALVCFFSQRAGLKIGLVAWLATICLIYRFGLGWIGYQSPCHCLGTLTDALRIPPQTADTAMRIILAYLLLGSYGTLFWLRQQKRKQSGAESL